MILASAGSGKTYALTGRFVRLLAEGAPPERIVALTFTKKAAGEFFDEILKKLAAASADAERARQLAAETGRPELGRAEFLGLLRRVTEAMPRLRLGTLDGFFARIIRAFPLELGLGGEFEMLQPQAERQERRRVLRRMFARSGGLDEAQREFIEAFKRATFGREEKRLGWQLDAFLDQHQEIYLNAPEPEKWGDAARIWPDGNPCLPPPPQEEALARLRANLPWAGMTAAQLAKWEDFFAEMAGWAPGADWGGAMSLILKNCLAVWPDIRRGNAEVMVMRKRMSFFGPACEALDQVMRSVMGGELTRRLETTRGIHAVVRGYEQNYHALVRRSGRLTFADVQRLLDPEAGAPVLSSEAGRDRLFIDYRLDAKFDHWLLDEFQDTSYGQWSVLKNLIDEAVQDPTGGRSFFCVGDVKQAIYTWREGDPRLFAEIRQHYTAAASGAIATRHLDESWRSGPPIIKMVNDVFGQPATLAGLFPGAMSAAWNDEWRPHVSALPGRTGQAAWLLADDEAGRYETVLRLLRELRPLERGMTCAVLMQTNQAAAELADYLRRAGGLPAVAESDRPVCIDNPLGAALLALFKAAAHPGDSLAWEHARMSSYGVVLTNEGVNTPEELTQRLLGQIHESGLERSVEFWVRAVESQLEPDDLFSRERARQLVDAARLFDATGSREVAEFVAFMEGYTLREQEGAAVVRVMTIHKSKGLGFDVVVLPDLEGQRLDQARDGLAVHKSADRSINWVMDMPPKAIAENDAVLASHLGEAQSEAGYEALALFYVGLTRAKRGLYLVTEPPGDSTSRNYPRLLAASLAGGSEQPREVGVGRLRLKGAWSEGDALWHEAIELASPEETPARTVHLALGRPAARRYQSLRPSAAGEEKFTKAAQLFSLRVGDSADFGITVHRLLAQVDWWRDEPPIFGEIGCPSAQAEAKAVLNAPELAAIWSQPSGDRIGEVWRERSFEMIWNDVWVTGTVDRVVIERTAGGEILRARIYDFKTDRLSTEQLNAAVAKHDGQMQLYRQAVARLTGLPLSAVEAWVVFTRWRRMVAAGC
jgi:ATP-dependent helicase/nuclease subunit A